VWRFAGEEGGRGRVVGVRRSEGVFLCVIPELGSCSSDALVEDETCASMPGASKYCLYHNVGLGHVESPVDVGVLFGSVQLLVRFVRWRREVVLVSLPVANDDAELAES
jgi:hypothetical protein